MNAGPRRKLGHIVSLAPYFHGTPRAFLLITYNNLCGYHTRHQTRKSERRRVSLVFAPRLHDRLWTLRNRTKRQNHLLPHKRIKEA